MTLSLSDFFLASTLVNYSVLTLWLCMLIIARDSIYQLHAKIFSIEIDAVKITHFRAMAYYKVGIFLLNLAPWIALTIIS